MSNIISASAAQSASYAYQSAQVTVTKKEGNTETSVSAIYESLDVSSSVNLELSTTGSSAAADGTTYKPDLEKLNAIKADFGRNLDAFKQMVIKLFDSQGGVGNVAMDNIRGLIDRIEQSGGIDQLSQEKAQEMISEDGYWGVNQTSQRIMDFAMAISGGDPSKIDLLRDAVEDGFKQAEKLWGGELPEISQQTYDKVMKGFDDWAASSKTTESAEAETEE